MTLPCPSSLNSLMLTWFALLFIPLLLGVVIAATKVPPIPVRGTGGPGELRPPAAVVGRAFAGIGGGARSNYEHMSDRTKLKLIPDSLLPNALIHSPGAGPFSSMPNRTMINWYSMSPTPAQASS